MDVIRIAAAFAVSLGIPVLAMVQPGSPSSARAQTLARPTRAAASTDVAKGPNQSSDAVVSARPSPAAASFSAEITRLSDEADGVDRLWLSYKEQCGAETLDQGFGREWFSVLDRAGVPPTISPDCRELLQLIKQTGDGIRNDVLRAKAAARRARLDEGTQVGLLRWHSLDLP